jgi:hypothetical protein
MVAGKMVNWGMINIPLPLSRGDFFASIFLPKGKIVNFY